MEKSDRQNEWKDFVEFMDSVFKDLDKGRWQLCFARICLTVGVVLFVGIVVVLLWKGKFTVEMWFAVAGILLGVGGIMLAELSRSRALVAIKMSIGLAKYAKAIGNIKGFVRDKNRKRK